MSFALDLVKSGLADAKGPNAEVDESCDKVLAAVQSPTIERVAGNVRSGGRLLEALFPDRY